MVIALLLACSVASYTAFDGAPSEWCAITEAGGLICEGKAPGECTEPRLDEGEGIVAVQVGGTGKGLADLPDVAKVDGRLRGVETADSHVVAWGSWCRAASLEEGLLWASESGQWGVGDHLFALDTDGLPGEVSGGCLPSGTYMDATTWFFEGGGPLQEVFSPGPASSVHTTPMGTCLVQAERMVCMGMNESLDPNVGDMDIPVWRAHLLIYQGTWTKGTVGFMFTCGLSTDGQAECWRQPWEDPGPVYWPLHASDHPPDMTPPTTPFVDIEAGPRHVCGRTDAGAVECWGDTSLLSSATWSGPYQDISAWGGLTEDGRIEWFTTDVPETDRCERVCDEDGCG